LLIVIDGIEGIRGRRFCPFWALLERSWLVYLSVCGCLAAFFGLSDVRIRQ